MAGGLITIGGDTVQDRFIGTGAICRRTQSSADPRLARFDELRWENTISERLR
jgi:hypothetical protein